MNKLWHSYFKIPDRITVAADKISLDSNTLGLHYRGNDKNQAPWDTNPVSQEDFITLVQDFLKNHKDIKLIFLATDEFTFAEKAKKQLSQANIINLGEVGFHKTSKNTINKGDRALLDCLLLSRCRYLLKCSSALSGFAKVINPELESYRVSASKLFSDVPYFPEAYIPKLTSTNPECIKILEKQFIDDWLTNPAVNSRFNKTFRTQPRYSSFMKFMRLLKLVKY